MKILKQFGGFIALFFEIVAIIMLFISPAVKSGDNTVGMSGFEAIFGTSGTFLGVTIKTLFNFLGFLALILLVVGLIIPLVPMPANFKYLIGAALLLIAGILLFVFPGTMMGQIASADPYKLKYAVHTPLIFAGIFTLLGFAVNAVLGFLNFKK